MFAPGLKIAQKINLLELLGEATEFVKNFKETRGEWLGIAKIYQDTASRS